jgi:hypothetical protein
MTKKMLQGIAAGVFLTTSLFGFNLYFTENPQIEDELTTFSEQDLHVFLQENNLVAVDKIEYEQLLIKSENKEADATELQTNNQDVEEEINANIEVKEIIIIIKPGMSSNEISLLLEANGLIDDHQQFADYLMNNQLETKIKAGEFQLSTDMTIEEFAKALT